MASLVWESCVFFFCSINRRPPKLVLDQLGFLYCSVEDEGPLTVTQLRMHAQTGVECQLRALAVLTGSVLEDKSPCEIAATVPVTCAAQYAFFDKDVRNEKVTAFPSRCQQAHKDPILWTFQGKSMRRRANRQKNQGAWQWPASPSAEVHAWQVQMQMQRTSLWYKQAGPVSGVSQEKTVIIRQVS
jgi:hypothetical protein